jgi:hypothetical protein
MGHAVAIHRLLDQWAGIRDEIVAILDRGINCGNGPCLSPITDLYRPSAPSPIRGDPPLRSLCFSIRWRLHNSRQVGDHWGHPS